MYFPPVTDWEVRCEGTENGLGCCGGFLKCCVTADPAAGERGEGTPSYSETWTRLEQPSAKDTVICKAPTTFFQIFPMKTLVLLVGAERRLAARCVALHWLLLTSCIFLVGFEWGIHFHCSHQGLSYLSAYRWILWRTVGVPCIQQRKNWAIDFFFCLFVFQRFSC